MEIISQTLEALRAARNRTKHKLTQLDEAIRALRKLAVKNSGSRETLSLRPRRKMSAAARRKISAVQKARWAKIRKQKAA